MEDNESCETSGPPWPSTEELISRWQAGIDPDKSFQLLFEKYYPGVHSFFERRGFPAEESQDLTQETFLRVYKSLPTFRGDAHFETWLFQVSTNLYRNTLRNRAARKRSAEEVELPKEAGAELDSGEPIAESEDGPLQSLLEKERSELLREALNDLPSQMRRCVVLRIDHGLKYREIAEIMRISVDTVSAHLSQARQILRQKLADLGVSDV